MKKHYISKILSYSMVGSLGFTIVASLQGCDSGQNNQQTTAQPPANPQSNTSIADAAEQGVFMVIRQTGENPATYELVEKYPSSEGTRAILKKMDGTEQILNEEELKKIAEAEAQKVEEGTSNLTQPVAQNQGLSLGETILASAAGALIGGMIANKLMGNANYRQHQQTVNQRAQTTMSSTRRPATTNNTATQNRTQPRSGFFGGGQQNNNASGGTTNNSSSRSGNSGSVGG